MDKYISMTNINDRHDIEHLLVSERLKESGSPKLIIFSILTIAIVLIILIFWAGLTEIDQIASGKGEILTMKKVQNIQHFEGGIVNEVMVEDGVIVEPNQPLFSLAEHQALADLKRLKKRQNSTEIDIIRLQTILSNSKLTSTMLRNSITFKDVTESSLLKIQVDNALMLHRQQLEQSNYNKEQLKLRLKKETVNINNLKIQLKHFEKRQKILESQVDMYQKLTETKAVPKLTLLNTQERLQEVIGDVLETVREITSIEANILDIKKELATINHNQEKTALEELNDLTASYLEIHEQINRAQDRVNRLVTYSPIKGIIKGIKITPGTVISPGEVLFEVVPIEDDLIAEVQISTNDIGHIVIGDEAKVKVNTYEFSTYGQLNGKIKSISASTFLNEENNPYYLATISLEKNYLGKNPEKNQIFPGMTITADIKTDRLTLLQYMLKPINRSLDKAFTER